MLHKTRGIVFKNTRYSESSIIVKMYTEKFGIQSYIVSGVRKANAKSKAGLYQHGNLLELVVYYKEIGSLFRISEAKFAQIYIDVPFNIVKGCLLIFYIEVLNKVIKEEESNTDLFEFIFNAFLQLDLLTNQVANNHLFFLIALSKYLGFYPNYSQGKYFNLMDGVFQNTLPNHSFYVDENYSAKLQELIKQETIVLNNIQRKILLHHLLNYFKLHIDGFGELKSPNVFEELFNG